MTVRVLAFAFAFASGCSRNDGAQPSEPTTSPSQVAMSSRAGEPASATQPSAKPDGSPPSEPVPPSASDSPPPATSDPSASEPGPKPPARSFDDVKGLTTAELVAHWGEPHTKTGERWTYRFPRTGCTEELLVYVLHLRAGKVATIDRRTEQTGKVCAAIE